MSTVTPKRLGQGQVGTVTGKTVLYTVPAATTAILRSITACNTDNTSARQISLHLVPSGASPDVTTMLLNEVSLDPRETLQDDGPHVLAAAGQVIGWSDAASVVTVTVDGAEVT